MSANPKLDSFTRAYIECALWISSIEEDFAAQHLAATGEDFAPDTSLESFGFSLDDLAPDTLAAIVADCEAFQAANAEDIEAGSSSRYPADEQAGHDFWLTRNGHGAGFWDGDWPEPAASRLTDSAIGFGSSDLYVGDDELVYVT